MDTLSHPAAPLRAAQIPVHRCPVFRAPPLACLQAPDSACQDAARRAAIVPGEDQRVHDRAFVQADPAG